MKLNKNNFIRMISIPNLFISNPSFDEKLLREWVEYFAGKDDLVSTDCLKEPLNFPYTYPCAENLIFRKILPSKIQVRTEPLQGWVYNFTKLSEMPVNEMWIHWKHITEAILVDFSWSNVPLDKQVYAGDFSESQLHEYLAKNLPLLSKCYGEKYAVYNLDNVIRCTLGLNLRA